VEPSAQVAISTPWPNRPRGPARLVAFRATRRDGAQRELWPEWTIARKGLACRISLTERGLIDRSAAKVCPLRSDERGRLGMVDPTASPARSARL